MILQSPLNTSELASGHQNGNFVTGVIDAKFESGHLVTVSRGSESLKGVLYQLPPDQVEPAAHGVGSGGQDITPLRPVVHGRRRRKNSEIKRRDPAHPKPNRSGYNFFFAEQHARLKPLHPGKDGEISRMIGELRNKLKDSERTVYKDQAMRDKERYRAEMEDYRERLRTGQVIRDAVPLQQCFSELQVNMEELPSSPATRFVVEWSSDRRDGDRLAKTPILEQIFREGKLVGSSPEIPRS